MNIKGIDFTNISNKKLGTKISTRITQSNVGENTNEEYYAGQDFYKLFNCLDIDWNGAVIDDNIQINDTADLLSLIISMKQEIKDLKDRLSVFEDNLEAEYDTDENGDVQLINYDGNLEVEYDTDENGDSQLYNEQND